MNSVSWVFGGLLIFIAIWCTALNWVVFWRRYVLHQNASSWVPLLGGLAGVGGVILLPVHGLSVYWFVPLLADWGSVPGLIYTAIWLVVAKRR